MNTAIDMVISVKETTIFSIFHPDAQDLYNTCSDLKKVVWELWDTGKRIKSSVSSSCCTRPLSVLIPVGQGD